MGRRRKFSLEQDADIAHRYAEGATLKDLSGQLTVSITAVRNSLRRSSVIMRPRSSPRSEYEWIKCACGKRATYKTGQCVRCYNADRNQLPNVQVRRFGWRLMTYYNMTCDTYNALLESQGNVCAICRLLNPLGERLTVDHDHACCPGDTSCGKCVRGLLCGKCNRAVGLIKDNPAVAARLLDYLTCSRSAVSRGNTF